MLMLNILMLLFAAFFIWASKIVQNWRKDRVRPFLIGFWASSVAKRTDYVARHIDPLITFLYLTVALTFFMYGVFGIIL